MNKTSKIVLSVGIILLILLVCADGCDEQRCAFTDCNPKGECETRVFPCDVCPTECPPRHTCTCVGPYRVGEYEP